MERDKIYSLVVPSQSLILVLSGSGYQPSFDVEHDAESKIQKYRSTGQPQLKDNRRFVEPFFSKPKISYRVYRTIRISELNAQ